MYETTDNTEPQGKAFRVLTKHLHAMVTASMFKSNYKIITSFFYFLHNITDSKFILTRDLIKSPFHIKEAL